jgi:hypothetical protein
MRFDESKTIIWAEYALRLIAVNSLKAIFPPLKIARYFNVYINARRRLKRSVRRWTSRISVSSSSSLRADLLAV